MVAAISTAAIACPMKKSIERSVCGWGDRDGEMTGRSIYLVNSR
jgi:hypothetical protein